jgi:hypothetical protein
MVRDARVVPPLPAPRVADSLRGSKPEGRMGREESRVPGDQGGTEACRRVDLRLTETGEIYVIEVNASGYPEQSSEFARATVVAASG